MKKLIPKYGYRSLTLYYWPLTLLFLLSCNNGPADPVKTAKHENAAMIDSQMEKEQPMDSMTLLSKDDAEFLVNAASGGMMEIQLGKLAQSNARNSRVKAFGAMMMKDHGEANAKLKSLAASRNITLPDSISNHQQKEVEKLQKKRGDAFDEAYINIMVDDHKKDIREFEKQADKGANSEVKAFANECLPVLRTHLDSARSIQKTVSKAIPVDPVPGPY
jgi:putative membrane protein